MPLVLWGPGVARGRDGRAARHVDIFPTVLAALGLKAPAAPGKVRPGRSLLAAWKDQPDAYFESLSTALNRGWAPLRGLLRRAGPRSLKFIALPLPEVYDLTADAAESQNRLDQERRAARAAFDLLPAESQWPPPRGALTAEEEARLRSLGYLASSPSARTSFGPEDDPKRLVALDRKIHQLVEAYSLGELPRALKLAQEVLAARPMALGYELLVNCLLELDREAEALAVMEKARAAKMASDGLLRQLGLTLAGAGRAAEAITVLEPLAATGDLDALNALAVAHSEAGRQRQAYETLQRVLATDPENPKAWEEIGLVELRLGHWQQARDASRKAIERRAGAAQAWNNLGVALFQLGDVKGALDAWTKAVERQPDLWDALWNLGLQAAKHGRPDLARPALARFAADAPSPQYAEDRARARSLLAQLPKGPG